MYHQPTKNTHNLKNKELNIDDEESDTIFTNNQSDRKRNTRAQKKGVGNQNSRHDRKNKENTDNEESDTESEDSHTGNEESDSTFSLNQIVRRVDTKDREHGSTFNRNQFVPRVDTKDREHGSTFNRNQIIRRLNTKAHENGSTFNRNQNARTLNTKPHENDSSFNRNENVRDKAMPTASPSPVHSAEVVGYLFARQYYSVLYKHPERAYRFYLDSSVLSRPRPSDTMTTVTTIQAINDLILSLDCKGYKAKINMIDAQDSYMGGVVVLVTGCLTGKDSVGRKFTQSFFLAPQERGYFVLNDIFRYVDENEAPKTKDILINGSSEGIQTAPTTPDQELSHNPDPPMLDSAISLLEEMINKGEEVYEPSNNERESAVEPPDHSSQNEVSQTAEPASIVQEDAPKKSYSSIGTRIDFRQTTDGQLITKEEAMPIASPSPVPSAKEVGNVFVEKYYSVLYQSPEMICQFYQDSSVLSCPRPSGAMTTVTTLQAINDLIFCLDYKNYEAKIYTIDTQDSYMGGVVVLVTGCLIVKDNVRRKFIQSFFLAPQEVGYFVLNDIFGYVGENEAPESNAILINGNSEGIQTAPTTPDQELSHDSSPPPSDFAISPTEETLDM